MHCIRNILVELDGDAARVESYCIAFHRTRPDDEVGSADRITRVRYLDAFERRGDEWRIAARRCVYDHGRVDPVALEYELAPGGASLRLGPSTTRLTRKADAGREEE